MGMVMSKPGMGDVLSGISNQEFSGITDHSARVKPGMLFVAYPGAKSDGRQYIEEAVAKGASAVLYDPEHWDGEQFLASHSDVRSMPLPDCRRQLSSLGDWFYESPSSQLTCLAVTGTNGKTSCVHFISQMLNHCKHPCGMISTLGYGVASDLKSTGYTTPDALMLQQYLGDLRDQGAECVAFEASSHALDQGRLAEVVVDVAVFTNLSQDHLDYHGTFEAYAATKKRLFAEYGARAGVVNIDDPVGLELFRACKGRMDMIGYGLDQPLSDCCQLTARNIKQSWHQLTFELLSVWGEATLMVPFTGLYQVSNLLAAVGALLSMGIDFAEIVDTIHHLQGVHGRMEVYGGGHRPVVVVDYAHTPAGLESVLSSARDLCQGQLWCVFGCGGDRDLRKRPIMGQIAERLSDHLVITDDNPRGESPDAIVKDILGGLLCPWAAIVEHDRCSAIAHAIMQAGPQDVVVICGKGHEPYQDMHGRVLSMTDIAQVQLQLSLCGV